METIWHLMCMTSAVDIFFDLTDLIDFFRTSNCIRNSTQVAWESPDSKEHHLNRITNNTVSFNLK